MYTFPELLKQIRKESNLTQEGLAEILGVSTILISMIETGQKEVSRNFVIKLADKMKVRPGSIIPFVFFDNSANNNDLTGPEKKLISFGEKLQKYLIKIKSKNLK